MNKSFIRGDSSPRRSKGGAVVRALSPQQCGPGSNSGFDAILGLSLLLVLSLTRRGFSSGTPVFPFPQKPTPPNSDSIWSARTSFNKFLRTRKCTEGKQITVTITIKNRFNRIPFHMSSLGEKVPISHTFQYLLFKHGIPLTFLLNNNKSLKQEVFCHFRATLNRRRVLWKDFKSKALSNPIEFPTLSCTRKFPTN